MHASLVDWLGLLLSAITVILVWLYLRETNRIRIATEAQLEAQIAPAFVVRVQPDGELQFVNLGSGPALHVRLSATERGSTGRPDLDRLTNDIDFIEKQGAARGTGISYNTGSSRAWTPAGTQWKELAVPVFKPFWSNLLDGSGF